MIDRARFIADLRALLVRGVKFRHLGREPETGLDCIHAPTWAAKQQGVELPEELLSEMDSYSDQPDGWKMLALMRKRFVELPVVDNVVPTAEPGDLLVLYVWRNPKHMAIVTEKDPLTVIEAWRSFDKGEIKEQALDFRRRIAACFRIPDFD